MNSRVLDLRALLFGERALLQSLLSLVSEMKELIGRPGSVSGLLLRIGQFSCASIAISVMVTTAGFATFTAFWYFVFLFFVISVTCIFSLLRNYLDMIRTPHV